MREKKSCIVLTFYTTAGAMAMEKRAHELGIPGRLLPAPRSITSDCGIAWASPIGERGRIENAPGLPEIAGWWEREL